MSRLEAQLACSVGRLALDSPGFPPVGGEAHSVRFVVESEGLSLRRTTESYGDGGHRLTDFFDELASNWRGWDGEKVWASDGYAVILRAVHDGRSSVRMDVLVSSRGAYIVDDVVDAAGEWRAHTAVTFDLGALDRNAELVRSLLGRSNNPGATS